MVAIRLTTAADVLAALEDYLVAKAANDAGELPGASRPGAVAAFETNSDETIERFLDAERRLVECILDRGGRPGELVDMEGTWPCHGVRHGGRLYLAVGRGDGYWGYELSVVDLPAIDDLS